MNAVDEDSRRRAWWPAALLVGAVLAAFSPAIMAEFVTWDDRHNLFGNDKMNPPSLASVWWYWTNDYKDLYVPVTYTVWSALAMVAETQTPGELGARLNPYVFHLFNVLLHAGSALAAYALLRSIRRDAQEPAPVDWPAWAGAMVFALHPVQVESVAWVSGTKDVLAGMLSVVALWQYIAWARGAQGRWWVAVICFVLAMLSKPSAVVAPLIAGVIDWLLVGRPWRDVIRGVGPGLVLALPIMIVARNVQPAANAEFVPEWWARPVVALDALAFYVGKIIAPISLGVDYGRSPAWLWSSPQRYWTWVVPLALVAIAIGLARRTAVLLAGLLVLIAAVLPVLGLVPFDFQNYSTVTDHYLYLAMLGLGIVVAELLRRVRRGAAIRVVAGAVLAALGIKTFSQCMTWSNSRTLFENAVAVNPTSLPGNVNLGNQLYNAGLAKGQRALSASSIEERAAAMTDARTSLVEAARLYQKALETHPNDATAHQSLGNTLMLLNRPQEAAEHYRRAESATRPGRPPRQSP